MTVATYDELRAEIADELERDDLTSKIPDFVQFFESMCNYGDEERNFTALRTEQMRTVAPFTPAGGEITLTSDVLDIIKVTYQSTPVANLTYVSPEDLDYMYGTTESGNPQVYTRISSTVYIRPTGTTSTKITYYKAIPALASNTTNWLLAAAPQAYVYGSLFWAHVYLKDPEAAAAMLGLAKSSLRGLNTTNTFNKGGALQMRASTRAW